MRSKYTGQERARGETSVTESSGRKWNAGKHNRREGARAVMGFRVDR